ncbi:Selenoprotein SelK-SelG [Popillia japonica]|uniref:Selenoprotein SelK-SelG n=1 Tax=Popillia japonica TaxID=7064 RepID=A0AAW1HRY3_POPJA
MVYVQNGRVLDERPFSLRRIADFFWGIVLFVIYFFKTLFRFDTGSGTSDGYSRPGGRGNGPGGGPGRGPRGPRTLGRVTTIQDCSMPGGG